MKSKICSKCKKLKSFNEFYKDKRTKDKLYSSCKVCSFKACKKYRENNPEKVNKINRLINIRWRKNNPERIKEYYKKRMLITRNRLSKNISFLIWYSLGQGRNGKNWKDLVDYTLQDLMIHLEDKFKDNMSWENYGRGGWEIDHIRPISSFNFNSYEDPEFKECWALKNLQPLWAKENKIKKAKVFYHTYRQMELIK